MRDDVVRNVFVVTIDGIAIRFSDAGVLGVGDAGKWELWECWELWEGKVLKDFYDLKDPKL